MLAATIVAGCAVAGEESTSVEGGAPGCEPESEPQPTASRPTTTVSAIRMGAIVRFSMVSTSVSQKAARVVRIFALLSDVAL